MSALKVPVCSSMDNLCPLLAVPAVSAVINGGLLPANGLYPPVPE